MTGKQVKEILFNMGVKLGRLSADMGMTQQNFSSMLKSDNVKSQFLEEIARALGKDISMFYPDIVQQGNTINSNNTAGRDINFERQERINLKVSELMEQNAELIRQNKALTEIITNLTKR